MWLWWLAKAGCHAGRYDDLLQEARLRVWRLIRDQRVNFQRNPKAYLKSAGLSAIKDELKKLNRCDNLNRNLSDFLTTEEREWFVEVYGKAAAARKRENTRCSNS